MQGESASECAMGGEEARAFPLLSAELDELGALVDALCGHSSLCRPLKARLCLCLSRLWRGAEAAAAALSKASETAPTTRESVLRAQNRELANELETLRRTAAAESSAHGETKAKLRKCRERLAKVGWEILHDRARLASERSRLGRELDGMAKYNETITQMYHKAIHKEGPTAKSGRPTASPRGAGSTRSSLSVPAASDVSMRASLRLAQGTPPPRATAGRTPVGTRDASHPLDDGEAQAEPRHGSRTLRRGECDIADESEHMNAHVPDGESPRQLSLIEDLQRAEAELHAARLAEIDRGGPMAPLPHAPAHPPHGLVASPRAVSAGRLRAPLDSGLSRRGGGEPASWAGESLSRGRNPLLASPPISMLPSPLVPPGSFVLSAPITPSPRSRVSSKVYSATPTAVRAPSPSSETCSAGLPATLTPPSSTPEGNGPGVHAGSTGATACRHGCVVSAPRAFLPTARSYHSPRSTPKAVTPRGVSGSGFFGVGGAHRASTTVHPAVLRLVNDG